MRPKANVSWGVYLASAAQEKEVDIGIAVAKKLVRRAVDRNQLKRMIREHVRMAYAHSPFGDIVVKLKKPVGKETRGRLRKKEKDLLREQVVGLI